MKELRELIENNIACLQNLNFSLESSNNAFNEEDEDIIESYMSKIKLIVEKLEKNADIIPCMLTDTFLSTEDSKNEDVIDSSFLRQIINQLDDVVTIMDKNLNINYINESQQKLSGFNRDEILNINPLQFVHKDDIQNLLNILKKARKTGEGSAEYRMRKKDGSYVWLHGKGKILNINGSEYIIVIGRDITERKNLETHLVNLKDQLQKEDAWRSRILKEAEERLNIITKNANDLITIFNKDLEMDYVNISSYTKVLGYNEQELRNKNRLDLIHPEDLKSLIKLIHKGFKKQKGEATFRVRHKDGHYIWFEAKGSTFQDKNGNFKALIISRNITQHKKLESDLRQLNKMKSSILSRISHELKTPLVAIKGNINLLLENDSYNLKNKNDNVLKEIKLGCTRLEGLIEEIITSSQLENNNVPIHKTEQNLVFLIKYVIQDLSKLIKTRNHQIRLNLPDTLLIAFEKEKLYDVIYNLLSNAIKYTLPGGLIELSTRENDSEVIVSIKDNGIGFTEFEKKGLFSKFGKIEHYGKGLDLDINGSGLGLFIAKHIVDMHEGKIWMESKGKFKGSTFYFSLPKESHK